MRAQRNDLWEFLANESSKALRSAILLTLGVDTSIRDLDPDVASTSSHKNANCSLVKTVPVTAAP